MTHEGAVHVPGYQVLGPLGRGGQGSVVAARHLETGTQVALKLVPIGQRPRQRGRFRREAAALRALHDRAVVRVLDHGELGDTGYLALELIEGRPLSERIARGLSLDDAWDVARELARGLAAAHAAGIVHRDVKPQNVLVADGRTVLVDFGLARFAARQGHSLTQSGALVGTPAYMAPEALSGDLDAVGPAADVYGWGATLYEVLSGRAPFVADSLMGLLQAIAHQAPAPMRQRRVDAPSGLAALIERCLQKDPARRPADGAALLAALEEATQPRPARRRGALALAGAGALLLVGAGAWALRADPTPGPRERSETSTTAAVPGPHTLEVALDPLFGRDAFVDGYALYTNDNFGAERRLIVGVRVSAIQTAPRQGYVWFPLEELPPGAQLERAVLELTPLDQAPPRIPIGVHRVLGPWIEGSTTVDDALDGVAWGVGPQPLTDERFARPPHEAAALAVATPRAQGEALRWDVTLAVRRWLEQPDQNHGLALIPQPAGPLPVGNTYLTLASRDWPTATQRPTLRLDYVGLPPRPRAPLATRAAAHVARRDAALSELAGAPPDERLRRVNALLVEAPADAILHSARLEAFHEAGRFEDAINEVYGLVRVQAPPFPPVTLAAAERLLDDPGVRAAPELADKRWTLWNSYWGLITDSPPAAVVRPSREYRVEVLQRRVALYGDLAAIVAAYRRARRVWPHDPDLEREQASLPDLCVQLVLYLLKEGGAAEVARARELAAEALEQFDYPPETRGELTRLAGR